MSIVARVLRQYLRTNLPGRTRGIAALASAIPSLRRIPVTLVDGQIIYLDLRDPMCADVLRDSPYERHPWEPDEQAVMRRLLRPGDIAYDIGAHFGEHAAMIGQLVGPSGRLIAFEANPDRHDALRRTVGQHGNGELLPYAVADRTGTVSFFVPEYHVTASLADWTNGRVGAVRRIEVQQRSIDDLLATNTIPFPQFIKCDVEGAEHLVFRGALRALDRVDAPIVMYEANRPGAAAFGVELSASTELLRGLAAPAYSFYWVQPGGVLVPVKALREDVDLFNLVAVPANRGLPEP